MQFVAPGRASTAREHAHGEFGLPVRCTGPPVRLGPPPSGGRGPQRYHALLPARSPGEGSPASVRAACRSGATLCANKEWRAGLAPQHSDIIFVILSSYIFISHTPIANRNRRETPEAGWASSIGRKGLQKIPFPLQDPTEVRGRTADAGVGYSRPRGGRPAASPGARRRRRAPYGRRIHCYRIAGSAALQALPSSCCAISRPPITANLRRGRVYCAMLARVIWT
jgi:hypothetical protein